MLTQERFENFTARAKACAHHSLQYTQYDDCRTYTVLYEGEQGLLMADEGLSPAPVHWAANDAPALLSLLKHAPTNIRVPFVPKDFVAPLTEAGLFVLGEFVDFFNRELAATAGRFKKHAPRFLQKMQAGAASALSMAVRGQSRGFLGETAAWFEEWMEEGDVLGVYEGDALAGFCCVSVYNEGTTLWLREIAVSPAFQGRGYGRALVEQAVQYGVEKGAVKGFLAADLQNANAIRLYESCGFFREGDDSEIQMARGEL